MAEVEKDILYAGRWLLPNGEWAEFGSRDIYSACANGNRMLTVGNTAAPLIWEHDWLAVPTPIPTLLSWLGGKVREWAAGYAKHTFGYATGYRVGFKSGEPVLYSRNEIPRAKDLDQFAVTRFVSPRVDRDYTDHVGAYWPGTVIGHIASTPTPVQMKQAPVQLGRSGGRMRQTARVSYFLSLDGGSKMAGEAEGKGGGEGGNDRLKKALASYLASQGHTMPENVNSPDEIALVLETLANQGGGGSDNLNPPDDEITDDDATRPAATLSPNMLSRLSGLSDGERTALEAVIAGQGNVVAAGRNDLTARLTRIEGRAVQSGLITAPEVAQMKTAFAAIPETAMLSMLAGQPPRSRAVVRLELLERQMKVSRPAPKTGGKPTHLSGTARTVPIDTPAAGPPKGTTREGVERARERARERNATKPADGGKGAGK